jgi:superfamily II DNA or RNA helicase
MKGKVRMGAKKEYQKFLARKAVADIPTGIKVGELNPMLFDFQRDITRWALRRGRAAIFADCGLGKTPMQLEWARHIQETKGAGVLVVAPLAVSDQTVREGIKFGVAVYKCKEQRDFHGGIGITNYERLHKFDPRKFGAIVLDESSILKSYTGKYRTDLIDRWGKVPFKLCCTATPSPNDIMELSNHAEFLGTMTRAEMLSMFFVHDGGETQKWRLKGHAESEFWKWVCSWAVMVRKPSDLGYEDNGFTLPELRIHQMTVESTDKGGFLFAMEAKTLQERQKARRDSTPDRVRECAALVNGTNGAPWLCWCNLNNESAELTKAIDGAVEVKGSDKPESKEKSLMGFAAGDFTRLISKPRIAGFGLNYQHCNNVAFVGLSDSYEQFYQAIRRCWRFGQKNPVDCYIITADTEGAVVKNIQRKEKEAERMAENMVENMKDLNAESVRGTKRSTVQHKTKHDKGKRWNMQLGDCVEEAAKIESGTVHYSLFSPPFASLYTYSNSDRDMGNCKDTEEFMKHFKFLVTELFRVTVRGRLLSFHCMNLPTSKIRDGFIGIRDFRGELIKMFQDVGFIYASEVCIWKNPVTAMQRTKAKGLLHKQIKKDSVQCRQGIPDYLVTMKKPGDNPEPVAGELDHFAGDMATFSHDGRLSIDIWQRYASPVWMDINPSNTLQKASARENKDERHICPLQLDVIHRALQLWTNPGDLVLSPFAGIGSEGYEAVKMGRRFIGVELKESYYKQAVLNLRAAEQDTGLLLF